MKVFYKRWVVVFFVILVSLLSSNVSAVDPVWTELSASDNHLCGPSHDDTLILRAVNISNSGAEGLSGINATLITEPNDLLPLTDQTIPIGDLPASSQALAVPTWVLGCAEGSAPGNHTFFVVYQTRDGILFSARDQASIVMVHPSNRTSLRILLASPSGVVSTSDVQIRVQTDKDARCRYGIEGGGYDTLDFEFSLTGKTQHREMISAIEQGLRQYHVICKDRDGYEAKTQISFEVDTPPFANIRLNPSPPLKEGVVDVSLETSEELKDAPSLNYSFDGSTQMSITLVRSSSRTWDGYLLIPATGDERIGSFTFFATDLSGNAGTEIHEGGSFLVDTEPPEAPSALVATEEEGIIQLEWYHKGDDADHYNIYRSSLSSDLTQSYRSTPDTFFLDAAPPRGATYFYRVTAVDSAGNEGGFSDVVHVSGEGGLYLDADEKESFIPEDDRSPSGSDLADLISSVEALREELNSRRDNFKEKHGKEAGILGIDALIRDKKTELLKLQNELKSLRSQNLDDDAAKTARDAAIEKMMDIKKSIPVAIASLGEKDIPFNRPSRDDLFSIVERFRSKERIRPISDDKYVEIGMYQEQLDVRTTLQHINIQYLDGSTKKATLIQKKVTLREGEWSKGSLLLENIPKAVAQQSNNVTFEGDVEVIDDDPLFAVRTTGRGEQTVRYLVDGHINEEKAKGLLTIFLPEGAESVTSSSGNSLTGFSIFALPTTASIDKFYNVAIVTGIIILVTLLVFHFSPGERHNEKGIENQEDTGFSVESVMHAPFGRLKRSLRRSTKDIQWLKEDLSSSVHLYKKEKEEKLPMSARPPSVSNGFLYPNKGSKEYAYAGIKGLKDSALFTLMHEMDDHINGMDYNSAARLYHLLVDHEQVARRRDANTKNHFVRLQAKLDLLLKINQLQACEEKEDFVNLKHLLNEIADLYNSLLRGASSREMEFLKEIENHHERCARLLLQQSSGKRR